MTRDRYLTRRGDIWYFQMAVPERFQAVVGRKNWKHSLHTGDRKEATRRARLLIDEYLLLIERMQGPTSERRQEMLAELERVGLVLLPGKELGAAAIKAAEIMAVSMRDKVLRKALNDVQEAREKYGDDGPVMLQHGSMGKVLYRDFCVADDRSSITQAISAEWEGKRPEPPSGRVPPNGVTAFARG